MFMYKKKQFGRFNILCTASTFLTQGSLSVALLQTKMKKDKKMMILLDETDRSTNNNPHLHKKPYKSCKDLCLDWQSNVHEVQLQLFPVHKTPSHQCQQDRSPYVHWL